VRVALPLFVRYVKVAVVVLMASGLLWLTWFLYRDFYQPLTRALIVAELKARVALTTVNKAELETVIAALERNRTLPLVNWATLANPFAAPATTPALPPAPR
jgi:hypothetical protein